MRTKPVFTLIFFVATFLTQSCARLAITNTNLFDPLTGSMLPDRTILIHNEHIIAIGEPGKPIKVPANAQVIDGSGKYVIPGLIDAHVHLVFLLDKVNIKGEEVLPLYLGNGITSVRDIGDQIHFIQVGIYTGLIQNLTNKTVNRGWIRWTLIKAGQESCTGLASHFWPELIHQSLIARRVLLCMMNLYFWLNLVCLPPRHLSAPP